MAEHKRREGNLMVSLTDDAYDYNGKFFTLEVTEMKGNEGMDNDADMSGLPVTATQAEIDTYLDAAMACAKVRCGSELNVRNVAGYASKAGFGALQGNKLQGASFGWQSGPFPKDGYYHVQGLLDPSRGGDDRAVWINAESFTWGFDDGDDPESIELDSGITPLNIRWKPAATAAR